ncbi:hypothetical protein Ddye_017786 [Dipteronia dyeriana]|uniref:Pentatricopeptide repeat-containing protein n=1 Tax=Dipteronia dyeriana TaxID=168575 RepID=A0AAD9X1G3_9ROSI|nr:hypothetical protein Ddye_017786 [Dipteronia dyeriana]
MISVFRNVYKLFDKITQRHSLTGDSINVLYYVTLSQKHAGCIYPIDFYAENDDVISWTRRISNLVKQNNPEGAIGLFKMMLLSDQKPNYVTVLSVSRAFGALNFEKLIKMVHGLVTKMGFESEVAVLTSVLGFYWNHDLRVARKLFEEISSKDVVLWSAMVAACVKNEQYMEAVEYFREMQLNGVKPNHVSVVSILPACSYVSGGLSLGKGIHGFSLKRVFISFTNVQNSLVDMYAKCGNLEASIGVFNGIWKKDLISWRTVIHGCVVNEGARKALNIFSMMQSCCFEPDETILRDTIMALLQAKETKDGQSFHCYIMKKGFLDFAFIGTALLHMYAKFGDLGTARDLFDQLNHKDLIAWSAMISLYSQGGEPYNALNTFKQMQSKNEKPNEFTFGGLLQACSSMEAQEFGESIHAHLIKAGYLSNTNLTSALIDLYCKFGTIKQGKALFDELATKDLICWSSMIKGYGVNGYGDEALKIFSKMLDCGVMPNDVVFISVLSACSQRGRECEGWNWFYSMKEKYGITPKLAHYACMVDLLSRRGNVEEALDFVKKMPVEPDKRIWGTLLAGCRSAHGSIETAEFVVERLSTLDPKNTTYHMILFDLYADEGRWEDVEKLRKLVDENESRKAFGLA